MLRNRLLATLLAAVLTVPALASGNAARRPWSQIHTFVYWLDGPDPHAIARSAFALAIIDYSRDGTVTGEFSSEEIETMRGGTCARRILAYLSIGEAEDYRWYWQPGWRAGSPAWIVRENPQWRGNFLVRYWDPQWQQIVLRYLDRIIAQGFDGVYLDVVDAYRQDYAAGRSAEMTGFVGTIGRYARSRSPLGNDFAIFVQNAEELAGRDRQYLATITGIGREETYVTATDRVTSEGERRTVERELDRLIAAGKVVLTVDYATRPRLIDEAYRRAQAKGYVPYVTTVDLDRLTINPGHEPVCRPF